MDSSEQLVLDLTACLLIHGIPNLVITLIREAQTSHHADLVPVVHDVSSHHSRFFMSLMHALKTNSGLPFHSPTFAQAQ